MSKQAGKGDKWRKGGNFSKFQRGMDSINWTPKPKRREHKRDDEKAKAEEARLASIKRCLEIREDLMRRYSQPLKLSSERPASETKKEENYDIVI